MRTFLIVVVAMLVPFAMHASGCRQDSQSRFPKGPEMKNLAAASFESRQPTVPYIPPIDPEIGGTPESTNARLLAVADRQSRLSGNYEAPGLFVLPDMSGDNNDIMAMAPANPYDQRVAPLGERYEPLPEPVPALTAPMLGAQPRPEFWSRPMSLQPLPGMQPPPAEYRPMAAPALMPFVPPAAPARPDSTDILNMPEFIPGVYLGMGYEPVAVTAAPPEGFRRTDEWTPPPLLSSPKPPSPAPVVAPAPVASHLLRPTTKSIPDTFTSADVKKALEALPMLAEPDNLEMPAPLPGSLLTSSMPSLADSFIRASTSTESVRPFDPPTPLAVKPSMRQQPVAPPPAPIEQTKSVLSARDVYRMDVWNDKVSAFNQMDMLDEDTPQSIMDYELSKKANPVSPAWPAASPGKPSEKAEQAVALEPLQKIQLRPLRLSSMTAIDAEVAAPPLVF